MLAGALADNGMATGDHRTGAIATHTDDRRTGAIVAARIGDRRTRDRRSQSIATPTGDRRTQSIATPTGDRRTRDRHSQSIATPTGDRRTRSIVTRTGSGGRSPASGAHVPALDGLRGVAIALVVAFHLGLHWASGGFVGVDIFFVLSGYLITSQLVQEQGADGRLALTDFWVRRGRRLLPALCLLLFVLIGVSVVDPRLVSPTALRVDGLATLFYVQNWHLALQSHTAQLAQIFAPSPLLHTWSLAIEEQFYLVWPLVVLVSLRRVRGRAPRQRRLWTVIVVGALASMGLMAAMSLSGVAPLSIYYDSGTRFFELLVGAGLALALPLAGRADAVPRATTPGRRRRSRLAAVAGLLGLAGIATFTGSVDGIGGQWLYRGGLAAAALAAAAVLWGVVDAPRSPAARLLSWRPAVALGRISYGVYLWHWPVLVTVTSATTGLHGNVLTALQIGLTLVVAVASFTLVERPFQRLVASAGRRRAPRPAPVAALA